MSAEYQSHDGPVDMLATPKVQYGYDATAESGELVKGLRPTRLVYPNGRIVRYEYADAAASSSSGPASADPDDCLNRVKFIADEDAGQVGTHLAEYRYLGLGSIVTEDYPEPRVRLDYTPEGYSGFDRFGRVIDHGWRNYATGQDLDRYQYTHDRAGNRTSRRNATTTERDEHYLYDGLCRLIRADRGNLDPAMQRIAGTPERQESWTLDATGNWSRHTERESGRLTHDQSRTHNRVNELLSFSVATGDPWSNPSHDRNGNMTRIPKPANPRESLSLRWDAWDRLVKVSDSLGPVAAYEYDPRGFRIAAHTYRDPASPDAVLASPLSRFFYHNARWQVLEERTAGSPTLPFLHYIYSLRYIDAPILRDRRLPGELSLLSERLYYLGDANFNVTALVDRSGIPVERYVFSPYGVPAAYNGEWCSRRTSSAVDNTSFIAGRALDSATGLCYIRVRNYLGLSGAFLSRDPLRVGSRAVHLYEYAAGRPTSVRDPFGLDKDFNPGFVDPPRIPPDARLHYMPMQMRAAFDMHIQMYALYQRERPQIDVRNGHTVYLDWVVLSDNFLLDVQGQSGMLDCQKAVDGRLVMRAKSMMPGLSGDAIDGFRDADTHLISADLLSTNVRLSLQRFTVWWKAQCTIGPKSCSNEEGCRALYKCKVEWTLYDYYDFDWYVVAGWLGIPFHIYASWKSVAGGTVVVRDAGTPNP